MGCLDLNQRPAQLPTAMRPGGTVSPYAASNAATAYQATAASPGAGETNPYMVGPGSSITGSHWSGVAGGPYSPPQLPNPTPPPRAPGGTAPAGGFQAPAGPGAIQPAPPMTPPPSIGDPTPPTTPPASTTTGAGAAGGGTTAGNEDRISWSNGQSWIPNASPSPFGNGGSGSLGGVGGGCGRLFGKIFRPN